MAYTDMPVEQARRHTTDVVAPQDLWEFWEATLSESRAKATAMTSSPTATGLTQVTTEDIRFSGFAGDRIAAWLHRPVGVEHPPVVLRFWGYGRGRGLSHEVPFWTNAGYAVLAVDMRGQGGQHGAGDTPDEYGSSPSHPGFLTRGIADASTYYYRRLMADAALAADVVEQFPGLDAARIVAVGGSQGGALAVAAAALNPEKIAAVLADVVFLSDVLRALQITGTEPYSELTQYLKTQHGLRAQALETLRYFDVAVLAARATAPALFSVGMMDPICPPSTVYAAFNAYGGPKEIHEYPYSGHEGGGPWQERAQLSWLRQTLPPKLVGDDDWTRVAPTTGAAPQQHTRLARGSEGQG